MNPSQHDTDQHTEELVRRVLEAVGPRHALPEDLRERWETTFRAELGQVVQRKTRTRRIALGALAASIAAVAMVLVLLDSPPEPAQSVAEAIFVDGDSRLLGVGPVRAGMTLASGQSVQTRDDSYVTMDYHGADVRLGVDSIVKLHPNRLELVHGAIYVDTGADPSAIPPVIVETELGTLSHLGTQFLVNYRASQLTVAVREGTIVLSTDQGDSPFTSEPGLATVVSVSDDGEITTFETTSHGELWDWVLEASPGFTAKGRSATQADILMWLARETGRTLKYETVAARSHAEIESLPGMTGLTISIDDAVELLNAVTQLEVDTRNGSELKVALKPST